MNPIYDRSFYKYYTNFRESLSYYFQNFMPVIHLDGPIIEIDEMWLGAKKKDPRGRKPAISQLIFGIKLFVFLIKKYRTLL